MTVSVSTATGPLLFCATVLGEGVVLLSNDAPLRPSLFAVSPRPMLAAPAGTNRIELQPDPARQETAPATPPAPELNVAMDEDPLLELPVHQRRQLESLVNQPEAFPSDWLLSAPPADPFRVIAWPGPPDIDGRNVIFEFGVLGALRGDPFGRFRPELLEPPETAPPSR